MRRHVPLVALLLVAEAGLLGQAGAPTQQPPTQPRATFRSSVELVTVNVVVRDRSGAIVRGLTRDDFTIVEDGRPQQVATFDFDEPGMTPIAALPPDQAPTVLGSVRRAAPAGGAQPAAAPTASAPTFDLHGRRLIVLFFDLSSMQPEDSARAVAAARDYIVQQLTPADTVAITALSTSLRVVQEFTSDRERLLAALARMSGVEGMGFDDPAADPEAASDTGAVPDDSEFAMFNTDRRLEALKALCDALGVIDQKKSVVYFSSGMTQTGLDNRAAMRAVTSRAIRANVSIYAADMRGLQAMVPGGDASRASTRGVAAFSGQAVSSQFDQVAASQEALSSLSEDTGGRAFFDQNNFAGVFDRVIADTAAYYTLGFTSTNPAKDGRFRRIRIEVRRPGVKLEHRAGYYAPRDFAHAGREDREAALLEQLLADLPVTDLPLYAASAYFRLKGNRYFVPVWLLVPGSRLQFARSGDRDKATVDILGMLRDEKDRPVGQLRDTIRLAVGAAEGAQQKNVQYQTNFELPSGSYKLKVVVRENQTGTLGSFETTITVPNLDRETVKVSSVVLGTQLRAAAKPDPRNPLTRGGQELVANVARVVSPGQPLYFYYEMYDPIRANAAGVGPVPATGADPVRVTSNLVFFRGKNRVLETPAVSVEVLGAPDRGAAIFQLEVPTTGLVPGLYTCQVNITDEAGQAFAFPRLTLYIAAPAPKK